MFQAAPVAAAQPQARSTEAIKVKKPAAEAPRTDNKLAWVGQVDALH